MVPSHLTLDFLARTQRLIKSHGELSHNPSGGKRHHARPGSVLDMSTTRRAGASPIPEVRVPRLLAAPAPSPPVLLPAGPAGAEGAAVAGKGEDLEFLASLPLVLARRRRLERDGVHGAGGQVVHAHLAWQTAAPPKKRHAHLAHHCQYAC